MIRNTADIAWAGCIYGLSYGSTAPQAQAATPPGDLHVASHELFSADKARMGRKDFRIVFGTEHMRLEAFEIGLLIPMLHIGSSLGRETRAAETEKCSDTQH